jgi:Zn ribbon nucleic-acid-binding protein
MKSTVKPKRLRKGSNCPACKAGKLIPIVYGLPGRELMEQSDRGEIELGGCVVSQIIDEIGIRSNDPELNCPACNSKFFRSGVQDRVREKQPANWRSIES